MSQKISIALAGNPNCGKTTLFNALTGSHQSVGNWPGVTVEKKSGSFTLNDQQITLVDLPGVYSLQPCEASCEDERVAREYILSGESSLVVNIVDASNLERNLYLTAQLIEMQVPLIVAVNMLDVAKNHSISVDLDKLAQELDCPVVGLVASRETGVDVLKQAISRQLENPTVPHNPLVFPKDIADEIHTLTRELSENNVEKAPWIAEQILEGDKELGLRTLKSDFTKPNCESMHSISTTTATWIWLLPTCATPLSARSPLLASHETTRSNKRLPTKSTGLFCIVGWVYLFSWP